MSEFKVEYSLIDADGDYIDDEIVGFINTTLKDVVITAKQSLAKVYSIEPDAVTIHAIYEKVIGYGDTDEKY